MKKKEESKTPKKKRRLLRNVLLGLLIITLLCIGVGSLYILSLEEVRTFRPEYVSSMEETTLLYDKDDKLVGNLYGSSKRIKTTIDQVPDHVKNAVLAIEDARFYSHFGIDIRRLFGALLNDIKSGSLKEGGSTIGQQLIKMTYLTNEKTFSRKIKEAVLAIRLESYFSKDQILEMYLNYSYFGNGAYGIETAAQAYFDKSVSDLSIAEGALLAGILKAPTNYAPHIQPEASLQRRNLVLDQMQKNGFLDEQQTLSAKNEALALCDQEESYPYGYFSDLALSEAADKLNLSIDDMLNSGYQIYTTMDADLQAYVEEINNDPSLFPHNAADGTPVQSAITVLHPKTNEIAAICGGREYSALRGLNRATQLKRQPGSTIKPVLVYAPALAQNDYTTCTMILDAPQDFSGYAPGNYGNTYSGWVTLRDALAKSLNIPAVKVFQDVGVTTGKTYAQSVGLPFEESDNHLALALGGFAEGVTPLQLCASYAPFANGGSYAPPACIRKIIAPDGQTVYSSVPASREVLNENVAYITTNILESCVQYGTAKRLNSLGIPLAAKTGTTGYGSQGENKDAWVTAYNPDYTITVWMGFDITDDDHCLPTGVTGGTLPTDIAGKIFQHIYTQQSAPKFIQPAAIVEAKIDANSLGQGKTPLLASPDTAAESIRTEYFTVNSLSKQAQSDWLNPKPPDSIQVYPGANDSRVILFAAPDKDAVYDLYKNSGTLTKLIGSYPGGSDVRAWDTVGGSGAYYVVARRQNVLLGGQTIISPPSPLAYYQDTGSPSQPLPASPAL
ncbi:MAG: transglycosylase domain-containing protein, partial [Christensenellales bacterium]